MTRTRREAEAAAGHVRYTYRLRVSSSARRALLAEWGRCRWVWNECVARSKRAHLAAETCGPARLDRMLTAARAVAPWLAAGSSVPQQQVIRDFGKSRAKAQKDIKGRLPQRQRAGMPKHKKKHDASPSLNYTKRGFSPASGRYPQLKGGRLHLADGIVLTVVWSRKLPAAPSSVRRRRPWSRWLANMGGTFASYIPRTRPWAAEGAEREPSTPSRCQNVPTRAPRAERCPRGTRTPHA